eukprot:scaffold11171_cov36-Phaeocystis_antarctica.AAC.1
MILFRGWPSAAVLVAGADVAMPPEEAARFLFWTPCFGLGSGSGSGVRVSATNHLFDVGSAEAAEQGELLEDPLLPQRLIRLGVVMPVKLILQ